MKREYCTIFRGPFDRSVECISVLNQIDISTYVRQIYYFINGMRKTSYNMDMHRFDPLGIIVDYILLTAGICILEATTRQLYSQRGKLNSELH